MKINKFKFYNTVRPLFGGQLTSSQVQGMEALITEYERLEWNDIRLFAYVLATVKWETASTMQPITELGGEKYLKSKKYYPYYGRDLCQTTHLYNYEKVKKFSGVDVVKYPELIKDLSLAVKVIFEFMEKGHYTGKKLSNYIKADKCDYLNARKIINGTDKAKQIKEIAEIFESALNE